MNRIIKNTTLAVASIFFAASTFAMPAHASLIGDSITATGLNLTPANATIGAGVEFTGINGFINFDFGASTLTLTLNGNSSVSWGGFTDYVFSGFDDLITGLSVLSSSGFFGTDTNFSFGPHSITLDMASGAAGVGSLLIFNIATSSVSAVPEPASMALIGLGLLGLGWSRRKKT